MRRWVGLWRYVEYKGVTSTHIYAMQLARASPTIPPPYAVSEEGVCRRGFSSTPSTNHKNIHNIFRILHPTIDQPEECAQYVQDIWANNCSYRLFIFSEIIYISILLSPSPFAFFYFSCKYTQFRIEKKPSQHILALRCILPATNRIKARVSARTYLHVSWAAQVASAQLYLAHAQRTGGAHVLASNCREESAPISIMDAMLKSVLSIVSNLGKIPNMIGNGICGYLLNVTTVYDIANKMREALDYRSALDIKNAAAHARYQTHHTTQAMVTC